MRHIPPLSAVRAFEAAARHGNFTKAGEELGITQAAVSYQVKLLEDRLGTALFLRAKRQVTLTPTGQRIAPLISGAFDSLDDAFTVARTDSESTLTISCSNTFGTNWLAVRLGSFQLLRPGLAVRLHTDDQVVDFARDEVDVAIRASREPWPGLATHFLMRVPIVPLASPDFLARHPKAQRPSDVIQLPRVSPNDLWWSAWLNQVDPNMGPYTSAPGVRFDSQVMDGNAALAGQGVAILNAALWQQEIASGRLVSPLDAIAYSRSRYWLVYPEYKRNAAKVRAFRDWLLAEFARDAENDRYGIYTLPEAVHGAQP